MTTFLLGTGIAGGQAGESGGGGLTSTIIMIALMGLVFYFLLIRPQSKRQKEQKRMIESVEKGDSIVTIGGIRGTVHAVKDETIILNVGGTTKLEFSRTAISQVTKSTGKEEKETKPTTTDSSAPKKKSGTKKDS